MVAKADARRKKIQFGHPKDQQKTQVAVDLHHRLGLWLYFSSAHHSRVHCSCADRQPEHATHHRLQVGQPIDLLFPSTHQPVAVFTVPVISTQAWLAIPQWSSFEVSHVLFRMLSLVYRGQRPGHGNS